MQIKLIADKFQELTFSEQLPDVVEQYIIPGASAEAATGLYGHVLIQQLHSDGISIRLQHYLLTQGCTFTLVEEEPVLKLRFHLTNHTQHHIEGLGNLIFYEQAFNLLYIPYSQNRMHFQQAGVYISMDVHYPVYTLWDQLPPLVLMNDFQQKVQLQQPAMLAPVNQVAGRSLLTHINQLMQTRAPNNASLLTKSIDLLKECLEHISEHPVWEPVTLTMSEANAIYHARTMMLDNLQHSWTAKELTQRTGLNEYKLKTGFQQLYQNTPADYLRDMRMEQAWQLLPGKKFSVSQVADMVGYTNLSAFSKAFKKYFKITARERSKEEEGSMGNRQ